MVLIAEVIGDEQRLVDALKVLSRHVVDYDFFFGENAVFVVDRIQYFCASGV